MTFTYRNMIDMGINFTVMLTLFYAGAGLWALIVIPYGLWNYITGKTRWLNRT